MTALAISIGIQVLLFLTFLVFRLWQSMFAVLESTPPPHDAVCISAIWVTMGMTMILAGFWVAAGYAAIAEIRAV